MTRFVSFPVTSSIIGNDVIPGVIRCKGHDHKKLSRGFNIALPGRSRVNLFLTGSHLLGPRRSLALWPLSSTCSDKQKNDPTEKVLKRHVAISARCTRDFLIYCLLLYPPSLPPRRWTTTLFSGWTLSHADLSGQLVALKTKACSSTAWANMEERCSL